MNLLKFLQKKQTSDTPAIQVPEQQETATESVELPEIPEHIFIEHTKPRQKNMDVEEQKTETVTVQALYKYLEQNLESKGYDDALMNPDTSSMEENLRIVINDLNLLISKVKTYYSGHLRSIDFHIETRKAQGMIEIVEELQTHRDTIIDEIKIVTSIEEDTKKGTGLSENLILSYRRGFRNGFAAITYNTILGKNK